jgi:homoserine O-succinyltransferase/O-acetyltransferase
MSPDKRKLKVAILDMNEEMPNQGMRCIREILSRYGELNDLKLEWDEFEVRVKKQVPDLSYDIYISSGGPGSPLDSINSEWENVYFNWLQQIEQWNDNEARLQKKFVFFICHSFQLACRHYNIARVTKRNSTAFGVFPIHVLPDAKKEPVFAGLHDPFFSVDSRDFQVIQPNRNRFQQMGASILCIEKERPHVPYERALMAVRFNKYMIGTQFHPEADAAGMTMYLQRDDKKQTVIANHGFAKWQSMIEQLNDPDKIRSTYKHVLPNFLNDVIAHIHSTRN